MVIHGGMAKQAAKVIECEKMLLGELYDPFDPELVEARKRARDLCQDVNATRESYEAMWHHILRDLFGNGSDGVWMQSLSYCDYGSNIELGDHVFFNFNCVVPMFARYELTALVRSLVPRIFHGRSPTNISFRSLQLSHCVTRETAIVYECGCLSPPVMVD